MTTNQQGDPPPIPTRRPALIWVIAAFYGLSAGWMLLSLFLIWCGAIPLNETQTAYFQAQTVFDHVTTVVIGASNLAGCVLLFLMRKQAFHCLVFALSAEIALTLFHIVTKNWLRTISDFGLIGTVIGWGISIAIILYSKRLTERNILE